MHRIAFPNASQERFSEKHKLTKFRNIEFNTINPQVFHEIQHFDSLGMYGSKIQTLVKHLLWCQAQEACGSKSIVFSAWADSLKIISHALEANGIPFLRVDAARTKFNPAREFHNNSEYQVLLLHGLVETFLRDSSILNVFSGNETMQA